MNDIADQSAGAWTNAASSVPGCTRVELHEPDGSTRPTKRQRTADVQVYGDLDVETDEAAGIK